MKAAICYEFGKPLVLEDVSLEPPGKGEVKVRVAATAICHSDIHSFKGEHGSPPLPAVGGNEIAGYFFHWKRPQPKVGASSLINNLIS